MNENASTKEKENTKKIESLEKQNKKLKNEDKNEELKKTKKELSKLKEENNKREAEINKAERDLSENRETINNLNGLIKHLKELNRIVRNDKEEANISADRPKRNSQTNEVKKTIVCKFHIKGYCKFGNECHYKHVNKTLECKYFSKYGQCKYNEDCWFRHVKEGGMQEHTKAQVHDANNNDRGKPFERKSLGRWTDKSESPNFPFLGYPFQKQTTRLKEKENAPMTQDTHQFDNQTYQRWWKSTGRTSSNPRENHNSLYY